ncbi:PEP-CTERM sorting domain-containing protein [uncultured Pseudodesulfovibrio sp.]|uniref:PEP-CTERM sorting domain-containing protein n=1 Tax=uncultured Pseudodesulfovibrio sp. TaxID=2035858 RepID=UPI0029C7A9C0|nr:PEP-CTERM sorting domain-containing protein [uncultured Pseudodesulfovibrio sp.]
MKRLMTAILTLTLFLAFSSFAMAAVYNMTVYADQATGVIGVNGDYPLAQTSGSSWSADNSAYKAEWGLDASTLFGRTVTLSDVVGMSYWTKKPTSHVEQAPDWYFHFYTTPFENSPGSAWYGYRLNTEPYFSANLNENVNEWNQWAIGGQNDTNALRFFDSSSSNYWGSYTDPLWEEFLTQTGLGDRVYGDQELLSIAMATGSGWNADFYGLLDGLSISVKNIDITGAPIVDTYNINFEAAAVPTPEPSSFLLLLAGLGGFGFMLHRRNKA